MAVTRIKNNQITDAISGNSIVGINANTKIQDHSITSVKLSNNLTYGSDLTITGNLSVTGTTTAVDTTYTNIQDPLIVLADGQTTGSPTVDIGYIGLRGNQANIALIWNEANSTFAATYTNSGVNDDTIVAINSYADFKANNVNTVTDVSAGGNVFGGNVTATTDVSAGGNVTAATNVSAGSNVLANTDVSAGGNVTGGNVNVTTNVSAGGNVYGANFATTGSGGNITGANVISATTITTTGDVSAGGNIIAGVNVSVGGNVSVAGNITATGNVGTNQYLFGDGYYISNINAGNVSSTKIFNGGSYANIAATDGNLVVAVGSGSNIVATFYDTGINTNGNLSASGNILAGTDVSAGGNVTGGNVTATTDVSAGGNVLANTDVSAGGNVTGGNVTATTNVSAGSNVLANTDVSAGGNVTGGNVTATTNVSAGSNVLANTDVSAGGNVTGGNVTATTNVSAGSNVLANTDVSAGGNVTGGNVTATTNVSAGSNVLANTDVSAGGNVTGGNVTATTNVSAGANVIGGNIVTSGTITATGTLQAGNVITGGYVTATGNVQAGNINTAGDVSATANVNSGNVNSVTISASGAVYGANINSNYLYSANSSLVISAVGTNSGISIFTNGTGNIGVGNAYINNLADPQQNQDAATKFYVDSAVQGLAVKASVSVSEVSTLANVTNVTNVTYFNGTAGVGATLTVTSTAQISLDGVDLSTLPANARVLIQNETGSGANDTNAAWNGIYYISTNSPTSTVLTRSLDMNAPSEFYGAFTFVEDGTVYKASGWVCTNTADATPITIGTTAVTWSQFSGAGSYTQGNGIAITGTVISTRINTGNLEYDGSGNLQVSSYANLTYPNIGSATGTTLSLTGNLVASAIGSTDSMSAAGNVYAANISTSGNVFAVANITGGNLLTGNIVSAGGNVIGSNLLTTGYVSATGNLYSGNLSLSGNVSSDIKMLGNITAGGYITAVGNISGGNVNTGIVSASGNVYSANVLATGDIIPTAANTYNLGNATNNWQSLYLSGSTIYLGNIQLKQTTTNTFSVTTSDGTTPANFAINNISAAGNVSAGGNVLANVNVSAVANVYGNNISATTNVLGGNVYATNNITAGGNVLATTNISAGGNLIGANVNVNYVNANNDISAGGNITGANFTTTGSQGNITGANVISGVTLTASGNIYANGSITAVGNIGSGQYLFGDGYYISNINAGNVATTKIFNGNSYANVAAANGNVTIGVNSNLVATFYNTGVSVAGNIQTNAFVLGANLSLSGNVDGALNVGGNVTGANLIAVTDVTAGGNVNASAVGVQTTVSAGGNIYGANLAITGYGTVSTGGNIIADINISAGANVIAGNVFTGGLISSVGNITAGTLLYVDTTDGTVLIGNNTPVSSSILTLNSTTSFVVPTGNTVQRPATGYTGMVRFNTSQNNLEVYDNAQWSPVGSTTFTVISDQQFAGDGATVNFTLGSTQTTNSCLVSINGVVQIPTLAYAVSGTYPTCVLTFTEAPESGDVIDVREITTTVTLYELASTSGNASVSVSNTSAEVDIKGNLVTTLSASAPALTTNATMSFQLVNNTTLAFVVRGTDGVTRTATVTLA